MNFTWIALLTVVIIGTTKLLTYLLGDKRKIRQLETQILEKEKEYAEALAKNQGMLLSVVGVELLRMRQTLNRLKRK